MLGEQPPVDSPGLWAGQTVVCIASGPSLVREDCDRIAMEGLLTIAVNSSWEMARFCHVIYAGDSAWWRHNQAGIDIHAERWTCTQHAAHRFDVLHHEVVGGSYNSGMRAIQFALWRGAARVLLLGYDASLKHGVHWHGPHQLTGNPDASRLADWRRQMTELAVRVERRGVEIINCSRHTELTCFPRMDLEVALGNS